MIYDVLVKKINPNIEEEIIVQISNINLCCFVTYWRKNVEVGKIYKANIGIEILDEIILYNQDIPKGLKQINNSFEYIISGRFCFEEYSIDCGILIDIDPMEVDLTDFAYLDNKNISLKVNRITLEFID